MNKKTLFANARILCGNGNIFERGKILLEGSRIVAVGNFDTPSDATAYDLAGSWLTPGFIDCHTHMGLMNARSTLPAYHETNEAVDPVTPHLRALDAFNPEDEAIELSRQAGFTTCYTGPGSANAIGGSGFSFKLRGKTVQDMLIPGSEHMKFALGENPKRIYGLEGKAPKTRMGTAALIRESLAAAQDYVKEQEAFEAGKQQSFKRDLKLEALSEAVRGRQRCRFHCHRADDIMTAIRIAEEFKLDYTLEHCTDGYKLLAELQQADVFCVLGPLLLPWLKTEQWGMKLTTAGVMAEAGIPICLTADGGTDTQFLLVYAGVIIREGLSEEAALRALTLNPAKLLQLDARIGSLEAGKDADLAVFDGNPFCNLSHCLLTMIDGEIVHRANGFNAPRCINS